MKNLLLRKISMCFFLGALISLSNCTNLEDSAPGRIIDNAANTGQTCVAAKGNAGDALRSAYTRLNDFSDQSNTYALEEHTSDEMVGPTRGTDWDDNGTWRKLHLHSWTPTHNQVIASWDNLNNGVFRALQANYFANDAQIQLKAESAFLKAFYSFYIVDLYGQLPYTNLADLCGSRGKISTRTQAVDTLVKDLNYAITNLPTTNSIGTANKDAAQFLLAKVYLNKAVYTQDSTKPAGPYTFASADMNKVIELCNNIIASGKYQIAADYFDNFHWENDVRSKELIFVVQNTAGSPVANVRNRYYMGLHYNHNPSGWNGFTTLGDFYSSFESSDKRLGGPYPGVTDKIGLNVGFLVGQQFDKDGKKLKTRGGEDLIFTPDVNIVAAGEEKGIRVIKYVPQPSNLDNPGTDYVFFRYADVLLMKAEALLRGGSDPEGETATSIINSLRTVRGASTSGTVDLNLVLSERGRELYYEGWRRQDLIRFGQFLQARDEKTSSTPDFRVVFPLPQKALDTNPAWKQNFGY